LANKWVTKSRLEHLCQVENLVLADSEGEEIVPDPSGNFLGLSPVQPYTVVSEADLAGEDEPEVEYTQEQWHEVMVKQSQRIRRMEEARKQLINELYVPRHPRLWSFSPEFICVEMREAVRTGELDRVLKKETDTGIYSFQMFTEEFCRELVEEVESMEASGLPILRPNSMNNYGVILDDFGFSPFFEHLREFILPISSKLYGEIGSHLDSHHAFIVQYKIGEDLDLDFHYDDSEVTLNVCLGKKFTGGSLYFQGLLEKPETHGENFEFLHKQGLGIIHVGKHRHGANAIKEGERYNLIVWFRDSKLRTKPHECVHCQVEHSH
jgi:hypothetical protein